MKDDDYLDERKVFTDLAQRAVDRALTFVEGEVKKRWARRKNETVDAFSMYLSGKGKYCRSVRNFIYDVSSANLEDIYVESHLTRLGDVFGEEDFAGMIHSTPSRHKYRDSFSAVIHGTAGSGKSMFMRRIFLMLCQQGLYRVPIMIELRKLNRIKLSDIVSVIHQELQEYDPSISREQIVDGLASGIFVLMFDGFDELKRIILPHYEKELLTLAKRFSQCPVVVAGRPTERTSGWTQFEVFRIEPLTETQTIDLLNKLDYDPPTKSSFVREVQAHLYQSHEAFLEVPLMATIMLLTYADIGRISKRRHEFFEDAFNALWSKHDARKEGFERQRYTKLDKQSFTSLVSAFSISSYVQYHYEFRDDQIALHLENASKLTGTIVDEDDFLKDMLLSTSLMVREGNMIRYSHRSFQEYFCAHFISRCQDKTASEIIEQISDRYETDYVLEMVLSINEEKIERNWVLPRVRSIVRSLDNCTLQEYLRMLDESIGDYIKIIRSLYGLYPATDEVLAEAHIIEEIARGEPGIFAVSPRSGDARFPFICADYRNMMGVGGKLKHKYNRRTRNIREILSTDNSMREDADV